MKNKVLFVGSNPSQASPDNSAFHSATKSYRVLHKWIEGLDIEAIYANISDEKSRGNRPISHTAISETFDEIIEKQKPDRIVGLGKTASKALSAKGIKFLEMPHPSGRNRLLNDPNFVEQKKKALAEYVK